MSTSDRIALALTVLTFVLVIVTAAYAYFTLRILKANEAVVDEMREQRRAADRAYVLVTISLRIGTNLIYLAVENTGRSPARALDLRLDSDFHQALPDHIAENIRTFAAFTKTIESLPPAARMLFLLGTGPLLHSAPTERTPKVFSVVATYASAGAQYEERTTIDLHPLLDHAAVPQDAIVEELKKLRTETVQELRRIAGSITASSAEKGTEPASQTGLG